MKQEKHSSGSTDDTEIDHYQSYLYLLHVLYELDIVAPNLTSPKSFMPTWTDRVDYVARVLTAIGHPDYTDTATPGTPAG